MADELRCYVLIDASAPRDQEQWEALIGAAKDKPMALAIRQAVHGLGPQNHINLNRPSLTARYMLGDFEIHREDKAGLLVVLNEQCAIRGIVEVGALAKFESLLQAELREAVVDLGYTVPQSENLIFSVLGFGEMFVAIDQVRLWFLANIEEWE